MKSADFGGIVDIKVKKERKKVNDFELIITDEKPEFKQSEIERDVFDVKIVHLNEKNERVNFPLSSESTGTIKTLQILGPLLDILDNGKVLFIDELELNLHPEISKFIVKMFNSNKNKNAQLIFTTHDTNLLDNDLLRKDQIYFTNKKPNKFTELDSLFDYNIRENMDFEKAYLNGRVGGIPFIDFKNSD